MGVVGIILLLIVPIPAGLLDFLIIINIMLALVILLTTMFVKKPLDFSVFPSLLLVATLFRLGLNVASTRLILGEGHAGAVITAFGQVTVGGDIIIGSVIFLILVVIQFIVVTKGAERVAEVGARFTLDAMPGKQMAIDADLNAGLITDEQAKARRAETAAEADFYGAMDGASKFVKGDAIAGIIILIINLVGGIAIGMLQRGLEINEALNLYALLTIGDGLVTQIPALIMAVATGMIVTRSNASEDMGSTASGQLTQSQTALMIAGVAAIGMGFIPGMPMVIFFAVGAGLLFASRKIRATELREAAERKASEALSLTSGTASETTEDLIEQMRVPALEILLAPDMVDMVSGAPDDLLGRVKALRRKTALEIGMVVPPVRTRDSMELEPGTYVVKIAGVEAARGSAPAGKVLALGESLDALPGTATVEPVFGLAGKWVPAEMRSSAEMTGATVIDRVSVLITHLSAAITANASRMLTREDVRVLTAGVKSVNPAAVDELTPALLGLSQIQTVLQGLLAEEVPINDLQRIYEALAVRAKISADTEGLIEAARRALGPVLPARHLEGSVLPVVMIDPTLEQSMMEGLRQMDGASQIILDPSRLAAVAASLRQIVSAIGNAGRTAVLVCSPTLRPAVRHLARSQNVAIPVLSYDEATSANVTIETLGVLRGAAAVSG
ncbi:MAG: flagellar biosynthesis protein FlhA [Arthrobacter sp.]